MSQSEVQDEAERVWFRRVAMVIMLGTILSGALPLLKNTLFPVERNR
jgi:hypothetical protein